MHGHRNLKSVSLYQQVYRCSTSTYIATKMVTLAQWFAVADSGNYFCGTYVFKNKKIKLGKWYAIKHNCVT